MKQLAWMLCGLLVAGSTDASLTVGPAKTGQCMLFQHRDMQGARMRMPHGDRVSFARGDVGSTAWRESPTWNDVVSSAHVDRRCHLRVWEHILAGGASKQWDGGANGLRINYVGDAWNDRISSATCTCD